MKIEDAKRKLKRHGYKIKYCHNVSGRLLIAKKHQRTYTAQSINGLIKKIF